jgi:hypothetical protein
MQANEHTDMNLGGPIKEDKYLWDCSLFKTPLQDGEVGYIWLMVQACEDTDIHLGPHKRREMFIKRMLGVQERHCNMRLCLLTLHVDCFA